MLIDGHPTFKADVSFFLLFFMGYDEFVESRLLDGSLDARRSVVVGQRVLAVEFAIDG